MTTTEIKAKIAAEQKIVLPTLLFKRQFDAETGKIPQPWVSHWEETGRIRIALHEDLMAIIKANPAKNDLAVKYEIVPATETRLEYKRYTIIAPRDIELTF